MSFILLLPVLLPVLAGAGVMLLPFRTQQGRNRWTLATVTGCSLVNAWLIGTRPAAVFTLAELTPEISIAFRLDGIGVIFLALISFLWPLASLYSFEYMEKEEHRARFFGCYTICYGVTAGVALSANMITMYLFVELLTLITVPLVAHHGDRKSMRAARMYMVYSISGAALSLIGIMLLISRTGRADFVFGGAAAAAANEDGLLTAAWMMTFLGFGVKAAIVPFHAWLPKAGVAPTPVTALLHAVAVVKSGVFAVIRSTYFAFGTAMLAGTWGQKTALAITVVTILYGSVTAFREQHIKRRLAYSTISNLSYILFGAMLMTTAGLTAAMSHFLFHGVIKITLFFCAGAVITRTGREYMIRMSGLGRRMPRTYAAYTMGALALTGVPLLPGFVSKMNLICAAGETGGVYAFFGIGALLLSALLMAGYLILPSVRAWIMPEDAHQLFTEKDRDPDWRILAVLAVLCITMLALGCCSVPVMNALEALVAGTGGGPV